MRSKVRWKRDGTQGKANMVTTNMDTRITTTTIIIVRLSLPSSLSLFLPPFPSLPLPLSLPPPSLIE